MLIKAPLRDQHPDQRGLNQGARQTASAEPFNNKPQRCCGTDQQNHGEDASVAAHSFAAGFAVELAVEERNGTAGEHDRVRDLPEEPRHVAEQGINGKPRNEQHHAIRIGHYAPAPGRNRTRRGE